MRICGGTQVIRGHKELAKYGGGVHWCARKQGHLGKHQCNGCVYRWVRRKKP